MKCFLITIAAISALNFYSPYAEAQSAKCPTNESPNDPAQNAKVKSFYDQGVLASKKDDWKTARQQFLKAWRLRKLEQIAANLGWAEYRLLMFRDAAEHFHYFLSNPPATSPPEERKHIRDMFAQVRKRVGAIHVNVTVEGAMVLANGKPIGCSPLKQPLFLNPGHYIVEVQMDGYVPAKESISVRIGSPDKTVSFVLKREKTLSANNAIENQMHTDKPNGIYVVIGGSLTVVGLAVTGIAAGFAIDHDSKMSEWLERGKASNEGTENECHGSNSFKTCKQNYYSEWTNWARSGNIAIGAGIATGVLAAGVLTYALWPRKAGDKLHPSQVGFHLKPGSGGAMVVMQW